MAIPKGTRVEMETNTITREKGNTNDILAFAQTTDTITVTIYKPAYEGRGLATHISNAIASAIESFEVTE